MKRTEKITIVTKKPTADMPLGLYKVVNENGIYWGMWRVSKNWCGEVFVMSWE